MAKWYAVEMNREDNDWGYGSYDLEEAKEMLKNFPNGLIAVIEEGDDPICVEEIPYSDVYDNVEAEEQEPARIWKVYSVGGEHDGEYVAGFRSEALAVNYCSVRPSSYMIVDPDGKKLENW